MGEGGKKCKYKCGKPAYRFSLCKLCYDIVQERTEKDYRINRMQFAGMSAADNRKRLEALAALCGKCEERRAQVEGKCWDCYEVGRVFYSCDVCGVVTDDPTQRCEECGSD